MKAVFKPLLFLIKRVPLLKIMAKFAGSKFPQLKNIVFDLAASKTETIGPNNLLGHQENQIYQKIKHLMERS